mgnify:FL=1
MKKLAAVLLAGAAIGVFTGCGNGGSDIGRDAALEAALNDAGVSESDTSRLQVSEERDDGRKIYEIRFDVGQTEYDYEILASDGQVISSDIDSSREASAGNAGTGAQSTTQTDGTGQSTAQDDAAQQNTEQAGNAQNQQSGAANNAEVAVSLEEESAIALEKVPGATENDLRIELDYDDGRYRYEGDIIYQQVEYDFEINADTGEVIEWSEERG